MQRKRDNDVVLLRFVQFYRYESRWFIEGRFPPS